MQNKIPVVERLVIRSVVCDASQNIFSCTAFPRGLGAFAGIAYQALLRPDKIRTSPHCPI